MPATPILALPIPSMSDLAGTGPAAISDLANSVEGYMVALQSPPRAKASGTAISLPSGVFTPLPLATTVRAVPAGMRAGSSTRITITATGEYAIGYALTFTGGAGGVRTSGVRRNGAGLYIAYSGTQASPAGLDTAVAPSEDGVALNSGDYLELVAYQSSGSTITVAAATLSVRRVA